jgi:hypothetical protein
MPATAIIIRTHGDSSPDQRYREYRGSGGILVLNHLRAIICLDTSSAEFDQNILLEQRIVALQIRPAECGSIN